MFGFDKPPKNRITSIGLFRGIIPSDWLKDKSPFDMPMSWITYLHTINLTECYPKKIKWEKAKSEYEYKNISPVTYIDLLLEKGKLIKLQDIINYSNEFYGEQLYHIYLIITKIQESG